MTAEAIAKGLGGRKAGAAWMAKCPTHDDREPSLSIRDADEDKVLVQSHRRWTAEPARAPDQRDWPAERVWGFCAELLREDMEIEPRRPKGQGSGS